MARAHSAGSRAAGERRQRKKTTVQKAEAQKVTLIGPYAFAAQAGVHPPTLLHGSFTRGIVLRKFTIVYDSV